MKIFIFLIKDYVLMMLIYIYIIVYLVILIVLSLSYIFKNRYYNNNFKPLNKSNNYLKYKLVLKHFYQDIEYFNHKFNAYKKYLYVFHYINNILFVYTLYLVVYYIYTSSNEKINLYLEIIFYVISGAEILLLIISIFFNKNNLEHSTHANNDIKNRTANITLLVAFGGSNLISKLETLNNLIDHSLKIYNGENIIICYNYRNNPNNEIINFIKNKGVRLVSIPFPNKSYAITYTSLNFVKTKYVMIIDDDVYLPETMNVPLNIDDVNIWGYMICAEKPSPNMSTFGKYLTYCQDIEYRFAGYIKQFQSYFNKSSTLSHHGAISLYEKSTFDKIMSIHDCIFDGEDYLMGILAYKNNFKMSIVPEQYIPTIVPHTLKSLSLQRIISWDYVILKYIIDNLYVLFKLENRNYVTKLIGFFHIWTIYQDFIRIPNLIFLILKTRSSISYVYFILYFVSIYVIKSLCILIVLYVKNVFNSHTIPYNYGLFMIIGYPLYTIYTSLLRLIGQLRYIFYFDPRIHNNVLFKDRPLLPCVLNYINTDTDYEIDWINVYNIDNNISIINTNANSEQIEHIESEPEQIYDVLNDDKVDKVDGVEYMPMKDNVVIDIYKYKSETYDDIETQKLKFRSNKGRSSDSII
jgi:hypothetical protein